MKNGDSDKELIDDPIKKGINSQTAWTEYLTLFMKEFSALPELKILLKTIAPLFFQYNITDRPEMSYWQLFTENDVLWGMGTREDPDIPTIIHKTDFETIKKVNSGEINPIQATLDGSYVVDGDMAKLMACTPILPLSAKAHAKLINPESKLDNLLSKETSTVHWEDGLLEQFNRFKEAVSEKMAPNFIDFVKQTAEDYVTEDLEGLGDKASSEEVVLTSVYIVEAALGEAGKERKFILKKLKKLGFDVVAGANKAKKRAEQIAWPSDVEKLFFRIISHSGRMVRGIAKRAVSKRARKNALKRHSKEISRMDVIRANLSETPGPFRKSMLNALDIEGITEEEIKEAKLLNSET